MPDERLDFAGSSGRQVSGPAHPTRRDALHLLLLFPATASAIAEQASPFDPVTGYRVARYRAPTGGSVPGGTRVDIDEVDRLVAAQGAVLIDVMPAEGAGPDPATGIWRLAKPRRHIPGSHWLPDVGYGRLTPAMEAYLADNLARLSEGDPTRPLVFYCQADCWMSWNAVKRAASLGYTRLYWYAEGTDGWRDWDRELVPAEPVAMTSRLR